MGSSNPEKKRKSSSSQVKEGGSSKKSKHSSSTNGHVSASTTPSKGDKGKSKALDKNETHEVGKRHDKAAGYGHRTQSGAEVVLRCPPEQHLGPVLASFPDFEPPKDVPFTLYSAPAPYSATSLDPEEDETEPRLVLAGETHKMRYLSTNGDYAQYPDEERGKARVREYDGEYMVGIYDPSTSSVTLRKVPLLTMHRSVRALANLTPMAIGAADYQSRQLARRDLGDLFGNRKMKAKASNADRMKVDGSTEGMQKILKQVTAGITATAEGVELPQSSQVSNADGEQGEVAGANLTSDALRTIPKPNIEAKHPAEAYPYDSIIPPHVFKSLEINWLLNATSEEELAKALPGPGPAHKAYIRAHVWDAVKRCKNPGTSDTAVKSESGSGGILKTSSSRDRVRLALYASLLWAFRNNNRALADREKLSGKLKLKGSGGNAIVLEDLLNRFTEEDMGRKRRVSTRETETKLLAHMFAIFLHLDNFSTDVAKLSRDLEMPVQRAQDLFRSMGCQSNLVMLPGSTTKERRMVLKTPLVFPKPRRGAPKR